MPKQRIVAIGSGASFTAIRATIACHYLKCYEDATRGKAIEYQLPDDDFATTYTTKAGDMIKRVGHGWSGLLGRPPGYNASGDPALGDILIKVRDAAGQAFNMVVIESVSELSESDN